jgi:hypothetical protein
MYICTSTGRTGIQELFLARMGESRWYESALTRIVCRSSNKAHHFCNPLELHYNSRQDTCSRDFPAMRSSVPEKLLLIVGDIKARGDANLTRLTVLKKWFETPGRLVPFALWIAARASSRKGKTKDEATVLFDEVRALLLDCDRITPRIDREMATRIHARLIAFQNEYRHDKWGPIRIVHNWQLLLVEKSLAIALDRRPSPSAGYKLAADYCQHYDPQFGNTLNGPSVSKLREIVQWMFIHEAIENEPTRGNPSSSQTQQGN